VALFHQDSDYAHRVTHSWHIPDAFPIAFATVSGRKRDRSVTRR
jgi:hypothetical protein